jgi:hypothetical protein
MVKIVLDRKTLPADDQEVKFKLLNQSEILTGKFVEGDDLFFVNEREYYISWIVESWEPINN